MDEFIHWPKPDFLRGSNLGWNIVMDDRDLDEKTTCKSGVPPKYYKIMTNTVGLTFNVGDTIPRFTISIEQDD